MEKSTSLENVNPKLAGEWHPTKNNGITPRDVSFGSNRKVWWVGNCGHEWDASPKVRNKGQGCPFCSGKRIKLGFNDLATKRPDLIKEWYSELNNGVCINEVISNSHIKYKWRCSNGHEWEASPNHRMNGRNCPYCCDNPLVLKGVNDLETLNPELAAEWNFEKNGELAPSMFTSSSSKAVWWKCDLGHEWKTSINHRTDGSGCPKCARARQTSFPEQAIFFYIKQKYPEAQNRYKDIFEKKRMEIDIFIPSKKIGIEYDGSAFHRTKEQRAREAKKYRRCKECGITLIRMRESNSNPFFDTCDAYVDVTNGLSNAILELRKYGIFVEDVDVERDTNLIELNYKTTFAEESLRDIYPEISNEWCYEENSGLTPDMFKPRSNRSVSWKCSKGHIWRAKIDSRVRGTGCPYCSNNKVLSGYNDLKTTRKDLMLEWDFERNIEIDPSKVTAGSGKKAWWMCKNGHSWYAEISSRNKGHGCPKCAKIK